MATLKNMTGMYGGGMVNAKQYMGGGMVNEYKHGGKVHKNLKPIPKDNPGLAKLPKAVRNKMGYMQEGGEVSPEMLLDLAKIRNLNYTQPSFRFPIMESLNNLDLSDVYMDSVRSGGNTEIFDRLRSLASSFGQKNDSSKERYKPLSDEEILDFYNQLKKSSIMESKEDGGLLGMMKGGMAKKKKKYGYQEGGEILGLNITPESVFQAVYQMPTDDGDRYYLGEAQRPLPNLSRQLSIKRARDKAMNAPQDSITFDMAQQILNPEEEKGGFLKKLLGMQEGGAVQDDAMMLQYLQSLEAQQANPFVPFDQRPPSSGEMMSPIPSGMEQGDMMRIIRDEREVLDMEDAELLRQKGKNFFEKLRLDSLQSKILDSLMQLDSGRIERLPADTSGFIPSSPMFRNRGMGL